MTTEAVEDADTTGNAGPVRPLERHERECADAESVVSALFEDAAHVKRREIDEAVEKLEAQGDLGDGQREAVEEMADAIVERLLVPPVESVRGADDPTTVRAAGRLFDLRVETDGRRAHAVDSDCAEVNDDD